MKHIAFLLIAMALPGAAWAQAMPDPPQPDSASPAALPDNPVPAWTQHSPLWDRVEQLPRGQKIKFRSYRGRWERCEFAGATDAALYCAPLEDGESMQAYAVDRRTITDFKMDHDVRNGRLAFAAFVVTGGVWLGLRSAHDPASEPAAVPAGLLGAVVGALAGIPASCIAGHCVTIHLPAPPAYGVGYNVPLRMPARRKHPEVPKGAED